MAVIESVILFLCQFAVTGGKTCNYTYYSYTTKQREVKDTYCRLNDDVYCCPAGCCYYTYDQPYYNSAGSLAGAIVGSLIGVGVLVAVIIAILCICRQQQRFAGRVMSPTEISVVHSTHPGPVVIYPQNFQQVNPVMNPPPYSAQQVAFGQQPSSSSTQFPQPTSSSQNSSKSPAKQEAPTYLELTSEMQNISQLPLEHETHLYLELTSEMQNITQPPPEHETHSYLEITSENVYEDVDHSQYEALQGDSENHNYERPHQITYQNQAFSP